LELNQGIVPRLGNVPRGTSVKPAQIRRNPDLELI
jgi:hypothetical protein